MLASSPTTSVGSKLHPSVGWAWRYTVQFSSAQIAEVFLENFFDPTTRRIVTNGLSGTRHTVCNAVVINCFVLSVLLHNSIAFYIMPVAIFEPHWCQFFRVVGPTKKPASKKQGLVGVSKPEAPHQLLLFCQALGC
jgi:hypothetical protein